MTNAMVIVVGCFAFGSVLMALASRRLGAQERRARWTKFVVYFAVVIGVLGASRLGNPWFPLLMAAVIALGALEIARALAHLPAHDTRLVHTVWTGYALLALLGVAGAQLSAAGFVYLVVATFDGFSQVFGQLLGRHKLAPRVSPGKTIEGALGGIACALCIALPARSLAGLSLETTLGLSVLICIAALTGDLGASWLKRRAGIKDFGHILPGHGGILDRFDSFIAALAASEVALRLLAH